LIERKATEETE